MSSSFMTAQALQQSALSLQPSQMKSPVQYGTSNERNAIPRTQTTDKVPHSVNSFDVNLLQPKVIQRPGKIMTGPSANQEFATSKYSFPSTNIDRNYVSSLQPSLPLSGHHSSNKVFYSVGENHCLLFIFGVLNIFFYFSAAQYVYLFQLGRIYSSQSWPTKLGSFSNQRSQSNYPANF